MLYTLISNELDYIVKKCLQKGENGFMWNSNEIKSSKWMLYESESKKFICFTTLTLHAWIYNYKFSFLNAKFLWRSKNKFWSHRL